MRIREIMETASAGATSAGSVATVAQPLGSLLYRVQKTPKAKYQNSLIRPGQQHVKR